MEQEITCQNCGLQNDYRIENNHHQTAFCNGCGKYIKHLPKSNTDIVIHFGKFKGTALKDFMSKEHVDWLNWAIKKEIKFQPRVLDAIRKHLGI